MEDDKDIRTHIENLFVVDKLGYMDVKINPNLLAILLLQSLPKILNNFSCVIKLADELSTPEVL